MKIFSILIPLLLCIFYPIYGWAACSWSGNTGTVGSPYTASDVQACITDAASKTGNVIIQIPNSTVTWSSGITVDMRSGWGSVTGFNIRGQNDCTLDGNGIPTACGTNITNFFVNYKGKEGKDFRLAHFRTTGTSGVGIDGDSKSWRFDHIFWDTVTGYNWSRIIWIGKGTAGWLTEGLIDHNYFKDWAWGTIVHSQPSADGGNLEWMTGPELGTSHAIYLENNKMTSALGGGYYITDNNGASRWVIRYNEIRSAYIAGHDAQVGGFRGALKAEIYNNTITLDQANDCFVFYRAGATGVFFNNTIIAPTYYCPAYISFTNYRSNGPWGYPSACSNTSGKMYLDTSTTYPQTCTSGTGCINTDGSASSPTGYPCRDQVGVSGNNPQVRGGAPFLFWNNTKDGGPIIVGVTSDSTSYISANREYCLSATTMPSTCNGVTTTYTPYTYPHPLQNKWKANLRILQ